MIFIFSANKENAGIFVAEDAGAKGKLRGKNCGGGKSGASDGKYASNCHIKPATYWSNHTHMPESVLELVFSSI